jgi:hypothetical protein
MRRAYEISCILDVLICLMDSCDRVGYKSHQIADIERLRDLFRKIPIPIKETQPQKFLESIIEFYDYYFVVVTHSSLDLSDKKMVCFFLEKLLQKITELQRLEYQGSFGEN